MLWQGIHRGGGKEFLDGVANLELLAFGEGGEIVEDRLMRFRSEPGNINFDTYLTCAKDARTCPLRSDSNPDSASTWRKITVSSRRVTTLGFVFELVVAIP
jgi:hypothetical protein